MLDGNPQRLKIPGSEWDRASHQGYDHRKSNGHGKETKGIQAGMSPVAVWEPASGREANAYRCIVQ